MPRIDAVLYFMVDFEADGPILGVQQIDPQ